MISSQKPIRQMTKEEVREIWTIQELQIKQLPPDSSEFLVVKECIPIVEAALERLVNLSHLIPSPSLGFNPGLGFNPELRFELVKNSGKLLFVNGCQNLLEFDTITNCLKLMVSPSRLVTQIENSIFAVFKEEFTEYKDVGERRFAQTVKFSVSYEDQSQAKAISSSLMLVCGLFNSEIEAHGFIPCLIKFVVLLYCFSL